MSTLNTFFFSLFPYIAFAVFLVGSIYRFRASGFKYSSLSSQFLEGKKLFWGSIPFHWGISFIFFGHLIAFLIPETLLAWNSHTMRLLVIEISAFAFALCMLFGLINLFIRRATQERIQIVSTKMDYALLIVLIVQTVTGLLIAYNFRWGSSWFAAVLTPYLRSLFVLQPNGEAISQMHWLIQLHVIGAFSIVFLIPFTRMVHFLAIPIHYIWRPYQKVIWYWDKRRIRDSREPWSPQRPKNN